MTSQVMCLLNEVTLMRNLQKSFFKAKVDASEEELRNLLAACKRTEKVVDRRIEAIRNDLEAGQDSLFSTTQTVTTKKEHAK